MADCLSSLPDVIKIIVKLHQGEQTTTKIWRYNSHEKYMKDAVCYEVLQLFPQVTKRGLGLKLFHFDELAGKVSIESDADINEALHNFKEESRQSHPRKEFMTLHAEDCIPTVPEPKEDNVPCKTSRQVNKTLASYLNFSTQALTVLEFTFSTRRGYWMMRMLL